MTCTKGIPVDPVAQEMVKAWRAGLRPPGIHQQIRKRFPFISLEKFNRAADAAWASLEEHEREAT